MLTDGQILTEIEKQGGWMENEPKQKEWILLSTNLCEVYKKHNMFSFMGYSKPLPEQLSMGFMLTNDHIEREYCKRVDAVFNFDNLNFN